jgi:cytochrome d ubiquinol oxidase subunit II
VLTTIFTLHFVPSATHNFTSYPWAWGVVVLNVLAIANIPRAIFLGKPIYAFASSAATIAALIFLFGVALYPNLLASRDNAACCLNVYNAASSEPTLNLMFWIAILGMPFVFTYTAIVYWVFRGKVKLDRSGY